MDRDEQTEDPRNADPQRKRALADIDMLNRLSQSQAMGAATARVLQADWQLTHPRNGLVTLVMAELAHPTNQQGPSPIPCRPMETYRRGHTEGGLLVWIFVVLGILSFALGIWFCGRHGTW